MTSKSRHDAKNYIMTQSYVMNKTLSQRQGYIMTSNITSKSSLWRQTYVMTFKSTSRRQIRDVKKIVMTSKGMSWRQSYIMMSKLRHDVKKYIMMLKSTSWGQSNVMALKGSSLRQKVRHDVIQSYIMTSKVRNKSIMTSKLCHDVKNTSWRLKLSKSTLRYFFKYAMRS